MVTFRAMLLGFRASLDRFTDATRHDDPVRAFHPLFEALNWEVALDDRCTDHWVPDGLPPVGRNWPARLANEADTVAVRGVRYARNRVHHQWADAVVLSAGPGRSPRRWPPRNSEWVWRDLRELPPPPQNRPDATGRAAYETLLAGHQVEFTLVTLAEIYETMAMLLEPPAPASAAN
jgi:hypothetical protein